MYFYFGKELRVSSKSSKKLLIFVDNLQISFKRRSSSRDLMAMLSSFPLYSNIKCSKCNNIMSASTKHPDARFLSNHSLSSGKRKSAQAFTPAPGALKPLLTLKVWLYPALIPATETKDNQDLFKFSRLLTFLVALKG